ncbi:MAG: AAA family ATPase [Candidatus Bilamarchaeaceae archaeon]
MDAWGFAGLATLGGRVSIDFGDGASGLIAIAGPNGSGKTTILELLHPFRLMPSRASGYTTGSFSFYSCVQAQAARELFFRVGDTNYVSLIEIDSVKRKQRAFLYHIDEHGNRAPVENNHLLSDGGADSYDKIIESLLINPQFFFYSFFLPSGGARLCALSPKELRGIFNYALAIASIDHARDFVVDARAKITDIVRSKRALIAKKMSAIIAELRMVANQCSLLSSKIDSAFANLDLLTEIHSALCGLVNQRSSLEKAIEARKMEVAKLRNAAAEIAAEIEKRKAEVAQRQREIHAEVFERISLIREGITEISQIKKDLAAAITDLAGALGMPSDSVLEFSQENIASMISEYEQEILDLSSDVGKMSEFIKSVFPEIREDRLFAHAVSEHKSLEMGIASHKQFLQISSTVPCAGMDIQDKCRFLIEIRQKTASGSIERMEERIELVSRAIDTIQRRNALANELAAKRNTLGKLREIAKDIATIYNRLGIQDAPIGQCIEAIGIRLNELRKDLDGAEAQLNHSTALEDDPIIASLSTKALAIKAEIDKSAPELSAAEAALRELNKKINDKLAGIARDPQELAAKIAAAESSIDYLIDSCGELLSTLDKIEAEASSIPGGQVALFIRKAEPAVETLKFMETAFSDRGVQALYLEKAISQINDIVNDTLSGVFGDDILVRISVLRDSLENNTQISFRFAVVDKFGLERDARTLSGGESTWVNEVCSRALAMAYNDSAALPLRTIYTDEYDHALDHARRAMEARLKRACLERGGFQAEFFVSHARELLEQADRVIELG